MIDRANLVGQWAEQMFIINKQTLGYLRKRIERRADAGKQKHVVSTR